MDNMDNKSIEWKRGKLKQTRQELESTQLNALRQLLPNQAIQQICEDAQYYFRTRLLTPFVTIFHMIGAAISQDTSFQSAWHMSGQTAMSDSLAKARKRLPLVIWHRLHEWITKQIKTECEDKDLWQGHRMIGIDGTCVSMSDEPCLVEHFGRCNTRHGYSRFPVARVLTAFNLKTLITEHHAAGSYVTDETALLRTLLPQFEPGDVLVLDRHFSGANLYVQYLRAGVDFIARACAVLAVERLKKRDILGPGDWVVEMPISPQHRLKDPTLPKTICVRVVKVAARIRGKKETFWLATSLMDPRRYPAQEIRLWYKRRWKVEILIEELKVWLGADVLRSKSVSGILKELCARVIALNLIHWLILKAGRKHQQNQDRISVSATLRLSAAYSLKMSTAPVWQLPRLYDQLLERIATSTVADRPDRLEPRMIKRERKYYDMLKIPRQEWRLIHAMAA